jgi:hypothetical protein
MNDYSADWPFWGGREGMGLCADDDPRLSAATAEAARAWAAQFNELYSWESGWPNRDIALAHELEAHRLRADVQQSLPDDHVVLQYWERNVRSTR